MYQRKDEKKGNLKSLLEAMFTCFDNSYISEAEEDNGSRVYWKNENCVEEDNIPLDSSQNIINFIKKHSNTEITKTPPFEFLARKIHNVVLENPNLLLNELDNFFEIQFIYIHQILSAYVSLMRENKITNINPLLSFIQKIIQRNDLWDNKKNKRSFNYELWTVDDISEFVTQYCLNYSQYISLDDYAILKSFIFEIYRNLNVEEKQTQSYISYMLNSESGKCIESLINLYFFSISSLNKKSDNDIKEIFIKGLQEKKISKFIYSLWFIFCRILL